MTTGRRRPSSVWVDFSLERNRLQLAKPARFADKYSTKLLEKSQTSNELLSKMTQGLKMVVEEFPNIKEPKIDIVEGSHSADVLLTFNIWMGDIDM